MSRSSLHVEHGFGKQLLQLRILGLQVPQPLGFQDFHAAKFGTPPLKQGVTKTVFPAQFLDQPTASASFRNPIICSSEKRFFISVVRLQVTGNRFRICQASTLMSFREMAHNRMRLQQ